MRSLDFTRLFTARKKIVFYRQLVRFLLENTHDCFGFLFSLIISGSLLLTIPVAQAGPMQDIGASSGPQCVGLNVNDSGYVVGICSESNGSASGFVAQAAGNAVDLAHLVAGRNCAAGAITNVGRILGRCFNNNSLYTGVVWNATAPRLYRLCRRWLAVFAPKSPP